MVSISALVLAHNEERMLPACLKCLSWCNEVLVLDDGSRDKTVQIAESVGARVIHSQLTSFAQRRNLLAKHAKSEWLLYIDADERVTPELAEEIQAQLSLVDVIQICRHNIHYGQAMTAGGWQMDWVTRGFRSSVLKAWSGDIHESPQYSGRVIQLKSPLIHLTHRSIVDGLSKTIDWTPIEAELLVESNIGKVTPVTIFRKGLGEYWRRFIKYRGYKDGQAGHVEAIVQAINRMLVYSQVWEKQHQPSISNLYQVQERQVEIMWEQARAEHHP